MCYYAGEHKLKNDKPSLALTGPWKSEHKQETQTGTHLTKQINYY